MNIIEFDQLFYAPPKNKFICAEASIHENKTSTIYMPVIYVADPLHEDKNEYGLGEFELFPSIKESFKECKKNWKNLKPGNYALIYSKADIKNAITELEKIYKQMEEYELTEEGYNSYKKYFFENHHVIPLNDFKTLKNSQVV